MKKIIYLSLSILLLTTLIILQILGSKERVGYLSDFEIIEKSKTNYIYDFRIRYYDKVFRNSDIYGVYPDLSNLPDYMKNAEMEEGGSPYGNFVSDRKIIEEKIDNINYTLRIKIELILKLYLIPIGIYLFILLVKYNKEINLYLKSFSNLRYIKILKYILFVSYIVCIVIGIIHHEPWRDEGQAWLIARDLSFLDIFLNTGTEGHPFLFHFIIKPFTFLPFYPTLHIINAVFVVIAVYILFFKNILNNFLFNAALILNGMIMYEYPIVARNYGLAFMLFVYIVYIYKYRYVKTTNYVAALGLLMNTTVIGSSIGFIESAFLLWRIFSSGSCNFLRRKIKDIIILWAFLLIILFQLLSMVYRWSDYLTKLNINNDKDFYIFALLIILFFIIVFSAAITLKLNKNIKLFKVNYFVQFLIKIILIFFFIQAIKHFYGLTDRHTFLLAIYLIFTLAVYINKSNYLHLSVLNLSFLILVSLFSSGLKTYINDIKNNFSGGKDAAKYIKDNGFDNKDKYIIIINKSYVISGSISPYFKDRIIYDTGIDEYISFIDYSKIRKDYNTNFITNLVSKEIISIDNTVDGVKLIYLTNFEGGMGESINFYKVTNN